MRNRRQRASNNDGKEKSETASKSGKRVKFSLHAPEAMSVFLAGDFNQWNTQSLPMKKEKNGVWKIEIKLSRGRYEYKYFADNTWVDLSPVGETVANPFGTENYVLWVK